MGYESKYSPEIVKNPIAAKWGLFSEWANYIGISIKNYTLYHEISCSQSISSNKVTFPGFSVAHNQAVTTK
jgi:hypothetical protein